MIHVNGSQSPTVTMTGIVSARHGLNNYAPTFLNATVAQSVEAPAFSIMMKTRKSKMKGSDFIELNSHFKGEITELQVAQAFLSKGIQVSKPLVSDSRYDFIVDIKHELIRIQVKTCSPKEEESFISFKTCSTHTNTQRTIMLSYSKQDVDYFATFYNGICYIVPVDKVGNREFRLRIKPTKNGQIKNINFAENFTLEKFLSSNE